MPRFILPFVLALAGPGAALSDQVIMDDLIVQGSGCFGSNCMNGEDFFLGGVELKLKDSFPSLMFEAEGTGPNFATDWFLFSSLQNLIVTTGTTINFAFDEDGDFGVGTEFPSAKLHVVDGDTPVLRLEQDPPLGNGTAIWEMGGNEENLFIRDAVAGTLPFRIRTGAPQNAIYVDTNGQVGVGLQNPRGALHVRRNQPNNLPHLLLQNRREGGRTEIWFEDRDTATDDDALRLQLRGDDFNITFNGTGGAEFQVTKSGDVRIFRGDLVIPNGGVIVGGSTLNVPDYVFADDYELMPLSDVAEFIDTHSHLPHIPSAGEIAENGLDMTAMQLAMLKSHEELVLHTLDLQRQVNALMAEVNRLSAALE